MDRDEKIKILKNYCGTWLSCEVGNKQCPVANIVDDSCDWDDMTDDQLDECVGVVDFMHNKTDMVNHPSHYCQGGIECIDAIKAATVNKQGIEAVCVANVIKYLFRYETKNGLEDVKKAAWYLDRLIDEMEDKSE